MSITSVRPRSFNPLSSLKLRINPARIFGAIILTALIAFEAFNYSTTDYALHDLLGDLKFAGISWSTILTIAFCGIDFAGIARMFTPEQGINEPKEVWYLFGAWLLAATMNAMLTWWGVAIAILSHTSLGSSVIPPQTIIIVVPIFVAIIVWVIRVLIIGSFSVAGNRIFSQAELAYTAAQPVHSQTMSSPAVTAQPASIHSLPKPDAKPTNPTVNHSEPTYHPASMSGSNPNHPQVRK
jgi:hypothetical protein